MQSINANEFFFPVVGGESSGRIKDVYGTAFCLSDSFFTTNEHVLTNATEHPFWGIGHSVGNSWEFAAGDHHEVFKDFDVGILTAQVSMAKAFKWSTAELSMLDDVLTTGFPYALDHTASILRMRSLKGTVVSPRAWNGLPGKPRAYELSFPCPRGISGAPLVKPGAPPSVIGVIFGNAITDMIVSSDVEKAIDGKETKVYERVESMHLGVALQTQSIVSIKSSLLGMEVGAFLQQKRLL
jgi:hypothetical protein